MSYEIAWSRDVDRFVLLRPDGQESLPSDESELPLDQVGQVSMASVQSALIAREADSQSHGIETHDFGVAVRFGLGVESDRRTSLHRLGRLPPLYVYLDATDDLVFSMTAGIGFYVSESEILGLIEPTLNRLKAALLHIRIDDDGPRSEWWQFNVRLPWQGRTLNDVYQDCMTIGTAIQFPSVEDLEPIVVLELLRAGYVTNLLGQRESDWLEVKSRPYDFEHRRQHRLELSKDVARFANSERGGLLIIGAEEDGQVITAICPMRRDPRRLQSYIDTLNHHLYPPVDGLRIETFSVDQGEIITILVPSQEEGLKPFIVRGAVVEGKLDTTYLSIVRRRGDKSIASSAEELHLWLSAGRAFLRGKG